MSLTSSIEQDYITAYKSKDALTLGVLRLLKTAMKNFQVEHMREPTNADVLDIIAKQCKQRQDSITQFVAAARQDLADKEEAELGVLKRYMPEPLTGEELERAVQAAVAEAKATSMRDMSKVMQVLLAAHKGRIDGKAGSEAVKKALQSL